MDLYEYQAKELFIRHGVPTTEGDVCTTPAEADAVTARIGGPVVVKAQVKTGGQGKAGGCASRGQLLWTTTRVSAQ